MVNKSMHRSPLKVYIVDGARTPFLRARGEPGPFRASDLALAASKQLLLRLSLPLTAIDEVITGCVMPGADEVNIARLLSLRLGLREEIPAWTVQRNCASGMQALDSGVQSIQSGRHHLVLAGGTEAMSYAPLLLSQAMLAWLAQWGRSRTFQGRLAALSHFQPHFLRPVIGILKGLTDPYIGLTMGQTAEMIASRFSIERDQMDHFSQHSHLRLLQAQQEQRLNEIVPLYSSYGQFFTDDDGLRPDSSLEKLARLKPVFEHHGGRVTAGNSAQITDGAAMILLASEAAVDRYQLPVLARIIDTHWCGLSPEEMGLGPAHAMSALMQKRRLKIGDVDYWEINEAFAAQVLAVKAAWESDKYCKTHLHRKGAIGTIPADRLNIDGGSIAIGHPVGASGARIVLHLAKILQRTGAKTGMASLCIGGGQGGAMLIQREEGLR